MSNLLTLCWLVRATVPCGSYLGPVFLLLLLGRIAAPARCGLLLQTEYRNLSVCLSVTTVIHAKWLHWSRWFGIRTWVEQRNHVLDGIQIPHAKRQFWGGGWWDGGPL